MSLSSLKKYEKAEKKNFLIELQMFIFGVCSNNAIDWTNILVWRICTHLNIETEQIENYSK